MILLPGPPRTLTFAGISCLPANCPELAGFGAGAPISGETNDRLGGVFSRTVSGLPNPVSRKRRQPEVETGSNRCSAAALPFHGIDGLQMRLCAFVAWLQGNLGGLHQSLSSTSMPGKSGLDLHRHILSPRQENSDPTVMSGFQS